MLFRGLCVLLLVGTASAYYLDKDDPTDDFNGTFIIFDVTAHKGSTGSLKSAFNHLKSTEYQVKIIGEDRAIFIVRDDDECETAQIDFHGLSVDARPARAKDVDIKFNKTGLVVMIIDSSLDEPLRRQAFADALESCGDCFRVFAVFGVKPTRCYLIGNIPLPLTNIIANTSTTDQCCDTVVTKRAIDFNDYTDKHITGCIDIHAPQKKVKKPVIPPHKDIHIPFPKNVNYGASKDPHDPIDPHKATFPPIHAIPPHKIEDPHFSKIKFPSIPHDDGFKPRYRSFGSKFDFEREFHL